jgi:hypothetical protein
LALETPASKLAEVNVVKLAGSCVGSFDGGISSSDCGKSSFCIGAGLSSSRTQALE